MNIEFTEIGWNDLVFWIETDLKIAKRINDLIKSIKRAPTKGLGKPEPLRYEFKGCWSRRINREHRIIYKIEGVRGKNQKCTILQCRYHYDK